MGIGKWVANEKRKEVSIGMKKLADVLGPSNNPLRADRGF